MMEPDWHSKIKTLTASEVAELKLLGVLVERVLCSRPIDFATPPGLLALDPTAAVVTAERLELLRRYGHVMLPNLLPQSHAMALNTYVNEIVAEGWLKRGDGFATRYVAHNLHASKLYHHVMLACISAFADYPVKPSFNYIASYCPGADLDAHFDRPQCDYTVSIYVGSGQDAVESWPLEVSDLDDHTRSSAHLCRPGDGVLFRGEKVKHWRKPWVGPGNYNLLLLHFVHEEFNGPLD